MSHRPAAGVRAWARRYPCTVVPRGYWCSRGHGHNGPCAPRPRWWNLTGRARLRHAVRRRPLGPDEVPSWLLIVGLGLVLVAAALAMVTAR